LYIIEEAVEEEVKDDDVIKPNIQDRLRDKAIEELREKTTKTLKSIEDKAIKAQVKVDTQKSQANRQAVYCRQLPPSGKRRKSQAHE
jgi:hypothetical protein